MKHGFIREVIRGWYIPAMPDEKPGDSTSWYTSFWDFCGTYLSERFEHNWCLSPEQSISLHIGDRTVPQLLLVRSYKGNNKPTAFLHNTSIFDVRLNLPDAKHIENLEGLNVYSLAAALVYCSANQLLKAPMTEVEDKYVTDAYHSLSIEGYRVTRELIELVRTGNWQAETSVKSKKHLDAMAARGYWDAFQEVKKSVRDMMPTLFDLLAEEESAAVRVVLGHFIFVYIHPYFDGNGRMGRFIMNLMMASGGYPWSVVPLERRDE